MHKLDISERDDNYVVAFEMPGIQEGDIIIEGKDNVLHVMAFSQAISSDIKGKNVDAKYKTKLFDKTTILEDPDFTKMRHTFFLGWLEVIIPKKI